MSPHPLGGGEGNPRPAVCTGVRTEPRYGTPFYWDMRVSAAEARLAHWGNT